ncbi:PepSY domain-containing protein [Hyphobacterium sp.]|uniref:PepSY domain-containing protein n=1 Tax=Hyphobacterium sp. TaxID=2004662 RepID=UPI003BABA0A5
MTSLLRWTIRIHKWLALIVGIQIILWVTGGVVMSIIPIETVRGEHNIAEVIPVELNTGNLISVDEAVDAASPPSGLLEARLQHWHGRAVWNVIARNETSQLVDAATGELLTPINRERAIELALADYAGEPQISAVEYFEEPTWEYRRTGPSWRISFADGEGTRVYVSPETGLITARRNDAWRFYDFFWMLHIMDYQERENFNNPLVITAALLALVTVFAGLILLILRTQRLLRMALAQRSISRD